MIKLVRPKCPYPAALERGDYKHDKNKTALKESTHGKCMYCESKILAVTYGDVEHILPKAKGAYPHLEFEWDNLGFVCAQCNNRKRDRFDTSHPHINPYDDDPADYFVALYNMIFSYRENERGELTIRDVELNRTELIEQRGARMQVIRNAILAVKGRENPTLRMSAFAELKKEADPDKEYSFFVGALLKCHDIL